MDGLIALRESWLGDEVGGTAGIQILYLSGTGCAVRHLDVKDFYSQCDGSHRTVLSLREM